MFRHPFIRKIKSLKRHMEGLPINENNLRLNAKMFTVSVCPVISKPGWIEVDLSEMIPSQTYRGLISPQITVQGLMVTDSRWDVPRISWYSFLSNQKEERESRAFFPFLAATREKILEPPSGKVQLGPHL
jgi:hypothetical protein